MGQIFDGSMASRLAPGDLVKMSLFENKRGQSPDFSGAVVSVDSENHRVSVFSPDFSQDGMLVHFDTQRVQSEWCVVIPSKNAVPSQSNGFKQGDWIKTTSRLKGRFTIARVVAAIDGNIYAITKSGEELIVPQGQIAKWRPKKH